MKLNMKIEDNDDNRMALVRIDDDDDYNDVNDDNEY